jgi:hypothetical protein
MVKKDFEERMYTICRQDLVRIEEQDVQWYEFFNSWIRIERSSETNNDVMVTVHKDEDSDYIGKLVISNECLNAKENYNE